MFIGVNTITLEQRMQKAFSDIVNYRSPLERGSNGTGIPCRYAWMTGVLMVGRTMVDDNIQTAQTDGLDTWMGRDFCNTLTDPELRFVLLHEKKHIMYQHLRIYKALTIANAPLANMAMDYVINLEIFDENPEEQVHGKTMRFATMPLAKEGPDKGKPIGLIDERFRNMSVVQVFNVLLKEQQKQKQRGGSGGTGTGTAKPGAAGGGFDEHLHGKAGQRTDQQERDLMRVIDQAIRQGAQIAGRTGSGGARSIGDLLEVQIPWWHELKEFILNTCAGKDYGTWAKPNRRYMAAGIYMPSTLCETMGELGIWCDTSGSISQLVITQVLTEVYSITQTVKPAGIRMAYWDTVMHEPMEIYGNIPGATHSVDDLIKSTKPKGGGGTSVHVVPKFLIEHNIRSQANIIFTDGYVGELGEWHGREKNLLWVCINNKSFNPPFGKVIHIN